MTVDIRIQRAVKRQDQFILTLCGQLWLSLQLSRRQLKQLLLKLVRCQVELWGRHMDGVLLLKINGIDLTLAVHVAAACE